MNTYNTAERSTKLRFPRRSAFQLRPTDGVCCRRTERCCPHCRCPDSSPRSAGRSAAPPEAGTGFLQPSQQTPVELEEGSHWRPNYLNFEDIPAAPADTHSQRIQPSQAIGYREFRAKRYTETKSRPRGHVTPVHVSENKIRR